MRIRDMSGSTHTGSDEDNDNWTIYKHIDMDCPHGFEHVEDECLLTSEVAFVLDIIFMLPIRFTDYGTFQLYNSDIMGADL